MCATSLARAQDRISCFSLNGAFERTIGSHGVGPGKLIQPRDVAVAPTRQLLIVSEMGRLQLFAISSGVSLQIVELAGSSASPQRSLWGVAISPSDSSHIYVADSETSEILRLTTVKTKVNGRKQKIRL